MRVRVTYSKLAEARFLGAKEVATMFLRAVRRARLPVAYSQGFHPLPRLSFGPALPMGVESEEEFLDIELNEAVTPEQIRCRLDAELPRGFALYWAKGVDLRAPSIDVSIRAFCYKVAVDSLPQAKQCPDFIAARLNEFHAVAQLPMRKHTRSGEKTVDAKQFVARVALTTPQTLSIETLITGAGAIKPHEFVGVLLGLTAEEVKVLRLKKIQTFFQSPSESLVTAESEEATPMPLVAAAP
jgi:radical SAM-linked protein